MSYKLNQQDQTRRPRLLARRKKENVRYAPVFSPAHKYIAPDGTEVNVPEKWNNKKFPAYAPNNGTNMLHKTKLAMLRYVIKTRGKEVAESLYALIMHGGLTKKAVYGKHPTKKRID